MISDRQFFAAIVAGIVTQGTLRDSFSQKFRQELSRRGESERQVLTEIVTGIVPQRTLRGSFSQKLWQELSRREL